MDVADALEDALVVATEVSAPLAAAGLILNKPWLVLGGLEVETNIPALFPLHEITWTGAECV